MSTPSAAATPATFDQATTRNGFYFWTSILLLAFLVIGFAPSLYLRAFFEVPPIPAYLHVHGAIHFAGREITWANLDPGGMRMERGWPITSAGE